MIKPLDVYVCLLIMKILMPLSLKSNAEAERFRDSSAQNHFGPGTPRLGHFGPFFNPPILFFEGGGGWGAIYCFILFMCIKTRFKKLILIFRQENREIIPGNDMSHVMRKYVFGISEHQETSKIHVKSFFLHTS